MEARLVCTEGPSALRVPGAPGRISPLQPSSAWLPGGSHHQGMHPFHSLQYGMALQQHTPALVFTFLKGR